MTEGNGLFPSLTKAMPAAKPHSAPSPWAAMCCATSFRSETV